MPGFDVSWYDVLVMYMFHDTIFLLCWCSMIRCFCYVDELEMDQFICVKVKINLQSGNYLSTPTLFLKGMPKFSHTPQSSFLAQLLRTIYKERHTRTCSFVFSSTCECMNLKRGLKAPPSPRIVWFAAHMFRMMYYTYVMQIRRALAR